MELGLLVAEGGGHQLVLARAVVSQAAQMQYRHTLHQGIKLSKLRNY